MIKDQETQFYGQWLKELEIFSNLTQSVQFRHQLPKNHTTKPNRIKMLYNNYKGIHNKMSIKM